MFLETILPKITRCRSGSRVTRFLSKRSKCHKCGVALTPENASLDHQPPFILIRAKLYLSGNVNPFMYGKCKLSCKECNSRDLIPNHLGVLFTSRRLSDIKNSARYLCNLVRK